MSPPTPPAPSLPPAHGIRYRPEIDGLRALAVIAVVLFHAPLRCPGGYVGVDVFFVLSGFLITSLTLRDLQLGTFSLVQFWERRARRIFPALSVMIAVSLVAGGVLLLPEDYRQLGKSAIAQAAMVANVYFWRDDSGRGGYFGPTSDDRPLLHTWSLAVEEQFYFFLPLLLIFLFRRSVRREITIRRWIGGILVASLVLAIAGVNRAPGATFYLLPTRAWELLAGSWLACLPASAAPQRRAVREAASLSGLLAILVPCFIYSKTTPFPGLAALPPVLGTALVIWANGRGGESGLSLTLSGRLLAWKPVVFVGLISYSLYLWHWPVLVFGKYWWLSPQSPWTFRLGLIAIAAVLAVLSWKFVETPFRTRRLCGSRRSIFTLAGVSTIAATAVGCVLVFTHGLASRLPAQVVSNLSAMNDRFEAKDYDLESPDIRAGRLTRVGDPAATAPAILLWGDSHGQHAIAALDAFCKERHLSAVAATRGAKPPVVGATFKTGFEADPEFADTVMDYIVRTRIPHVILAARWQWYGGLDAPALEQSLARTIRQLDGLGCKVWILQDFPDVNVNAPKALMRESVLRTRDPGWRRRIDDYRSANAAVDRLTSQGLPAEFLDPTPSLLDEKEGCFQADLGGVSIYFDSNHLTPTASRTLLLPLLRERMGGTLH